MILDRFKTSRKNIEPIFQLTTVQKAEVKNGVLTISAKNNTKSACVSVNTLIPVRPEIKILTGDASRTFQGIHIPARFPDRREAHGSRIELRGKEDTFLNVLQVHDGELKPYPVSCSRKDGRTSVLLSIPGKACLTSFGNVDKVTDSAFSINIPEDNTQVLLLDLAPGKWSAVNKNSKKTFVVTKSNGSLYSVLSKGTWHLNLIKK